LKVSRLSVIVDEMIPDFEQSCKERDTPGYETQITLKHQLGKAKV
jgi:hypothetical protein